MFRSFARHSRRHLLRRSLHFHPPRSLHTHPSPRYWGRALAGWARFHEAAPNATHAALARMESEGHIDRLITQNVDGLHQKAGHERVVELHGNARHVGCLDCGQEMPRDDYHASLRGANAAWVEAHVAGVEEEEQGARSEMRADADADLDADFSSLDVPGCSACGGVMKPTVVFFGANVPKAVTQNCTQQATDCDGLLCIGTSLMVFSSYRLAKIAADNGIPLAIANIGPTRADEKLHHALTTRLDTVPSGTLLPAVADLLAEGR